MHPVYLNAMEILGMMQQGDQRLPVSHVRFKKAIEIVLGIISGEKIIKLLLRREDIYESKSNCYNLVGL